MGCWSTSKQAVAVEEYQIRSQYRAACVEHGAHTDRGANPALINAAYDRMVEIVKALRQLPDQGRAALTTFLSDADINVRCHAAAHLLQLEPALSERVLEETAKSTEKSLAPVSAKWLLREWRAGKLKGP